MFALNLFTKSNCARSEMISFLLHEKGQEFRTIFVDTATGEALSKEIFKAVQAPALVDHDVRLTDLDLILEYIDERYPHPTMMPPEPSKRAHTRILLRRVFNDLYPLLDRFKDTGCQESAARLGIELNNFAPVFSAQPFLVNEYFNLIDIAFVPLLRHISPHVSLSPGIIKYLDRLTSREAFKKTVVPGTK
jgi:RNA polymerase-associated protein